MDLTISLPQEVSERAHKLAEEMGLSVDQLFALAITRLIGSLGAELVKEALDAVYENEPSGLDPALVRLQAATLGREEW